MRRIFIVLSIVVLVATAGMAILVVHGLWQANNWIDLCADETSKNYIADEKLRRESCDRKPG
jgi:hypothetical protein